MEHRQPRSTVLTTEEESMIVAFRQRTLLALDDCLNALQLSIPHLASSSLHHCLQRYGISRLPEVEGDKPANLDITKRFRNLSQPVSVVGIGFFDFDHGQHGRAEHRGDPLGVVHHVAMMAFSVRDYTYRCRARTLTFPIRSG